MLGAGLAVDEDHAFGLAVLALRDRAHHRVGDDVEIAGVQRRRQVHRGRLVVSPDRAAAAAGRREEAGGALLHVGREDALRLRVARMQ